MTDHFKSRFIPHADWEEAGGGDVRRDPQPQDGLPRIQKKNAQAKKLGKVPFTVATSPLGFDRVGTSKSAIYSYDFLTRLSSIRYK